MLSASNVEKEKGYTLLELLIVLGVLAVVMAIMAPMFGSLYTLKRSSDIIDEKNKNFMIADALKEWSVTYNNYALPDPFSDEDWQSVVADPDGVTAFDVSLRDSLNGYGISVEEANMVFPGQRARVYQKVTGGSIEAPVTGTVAPYATVSYDIGLLYSSDCSREDDSCYPDAVTGIAGFSEQATLANFNTWTTGDGDFGLYRFSNLDEQLDALEDTGKIINRLKAQFLEYVNAIYLSGSPDPAINNFPAPDLGTSPDFSGSSPATNEGCRDGWYDLSAANVNVLEIMGLDQNEYGTTAWGGAIEYCRDLDVSGAGTPNAPPHNAAMRIHPLVSQGNAPAAGGGNLVFGI